MATLTSSKKRRSRSMDKGIDAIFKEKPIWSDEEEDADWFRTSHVWQQRIQQKLDIIAQFIYPVPKKLFEEQIIPFLQSQQDKQQGLIGSGGFANVYRFNQFAIKQLKPSRHINQRDYDRFLHEIIIMKHLQHKNCVSLYYAQPSKPICCILMEYVNGPTLQDYLQLNPSLSQSEKCLLALQILEAVEYLHNTLQMVHRDLKSANVLLHIDENKQVQVKLCDFTYTHWIEKLKRVVAPHGTPLWMAPEVIRNDTKIDYKAADVFSVGVILYEIFSQRKPYEGSNSLEVLEKMSLEKDFRISLPKEEPWTVVVDQCWQEDASKRPSITQLLHKLREMSVTKLFQ